MRALVLSLGLVILLGNARAQAEGDEQIINNSSLGYYNNSIGNILNGSDPGFPSGGDPSIPNAPEPNLNAAAAILGNWLSSPPELNTNWSGLQTTPFSWPSGHETAAVYPFGNEGTAWTDITIQIGADNGAFVWLNGQYLGGQVMPGGVVPGELTLTVAALGPGEHFLQIIREDHGGSTGFSISMTGVPSAPIDPKVILSPVEDGGVRFAIEAEKLSVERVDGQWWPAVSMIPSPPQEAQVILEFDLGSISGELIGQATLRYFVGGGNGAYGAVRLETWSYPGNGVVDVGDFDAGATFHGLFEWDSPTPEYPTPPVNEWVEYDVKAALRDADDFIGFNIRLAGDFPRYDGNEFDPNNPFRFLGIASSENGVDGGALRPTLEVTLLPSPDLAVAAIDVPNEGTAGQPIEVEWTVKNEGELSATGQWVDRVWLSKTTGAHPSNILLAETVIEGPLAPDESYLRQLVVTLPRYLVGPYQILVQTNVHGARGAGAPSGTQASEPIIISTDNREVRPFTPGNLILFDGVWGASKLDEYDPVGTWVRSFPQIEGSLFGPGSLHFGEDGKLYVHLGLSLPGVPTRAGIATLDGSGELLEFREFPVDTYINGWAIDDNDQIYGVHSDQIVDRIRRWDSLLRTYEELPVTEPGCLGDERAVIVGEKMFIATNHCIAVYDIEEMVQSGSFPAPTDMNEIAVSADGRLAINWQWYFPPFTFPAVAHVFQLDGTPLGGAVMPVPGWSTQTLAFSPDGRLFVRSWDRTVEPPTPKLVEFDSTLTYVRTIVPAETTSADGGIAFVPSIPKFPDLQVADGSTGSAGIGGQPFQVSWTVTNSGEATADGPWSDRVYISSEPTFSAAAQPLGPPLGFTGSLAPGESYPRAAQYTYPTTAGSYWIFIVTDVDNDVQEVPRGEANNISAAFGPIEVVALPKPDLIVTSVTRPSDGILSGSVTEVTFTVQNIGTGPTNVPNWKDLLFFTSAPQLVPPPAFLLNEQILAQPTNPQFLLPNETYTQTVQVSLPSNIQGNYYFGVYADGSPNGPQGSVFGMSEINEGNNLKFGPPFFVQLQPQPDLRVVEGSISIPSLVFSGQQLSVSWTETNAGIGTTGTGMWSHAIYFSTNNVPEISPGDVHFKTITTAIAPLPPGQSSGFSSSGGISPSLSGTYFVKVFADSANNVTEIGFEGNNVGVSSQQIEIILSPAIDLVPTTLAVSGSPVTYPAHPITVQFSVENQGAPPSPSFPLTWGDGIYLSTSEAFDPSTAVLLGAASQSTTLVDGQLAIPPYTKTRKVTIPSSVSAGAYYLHLVVDHLNQVYEGICPDLCEHNNILATTQTITVEPLYANLVIGAVSPAPGTSAAAASPIALQWQVTNSGDVVTPVSSWADRVYLSADPLFGPGDTLLTTLPRNGTLAPGAAYTASSSASVPLLAAGEYYLLFVADHANAVYEGPSGTADNVVAVPFSISGEVSDLIVNAVSAPRAVLAGQPLSVEWTVSNVGTQPTNAATWVDRVYFSTSAAFGPSAIEMAARTHSGVLAAGASYAESVAFTVPVNFEGEYFVFVRTDTGNVVWELNEQNNVTAAPSTINVTALDLPNLRIAAVSAAESSSSGQPIEVTWTVENNGPGSTFTTWRDSIYLSLDAFLDIPGDLHLSTIDRAGVLHSGESYADTRNLTVPLGVNGPFFVIVKTDGLNTVPETNESDNVGVASSLTTIELPPPGDLVVASVGSLSSKLVLGQSATFDWVIANVGASTVSGQWKDSLYLSPVPQWIPSAVKIGTFTTATGSPLIPGTSVTSSATAPVPGVTPGEYYLVARADVFNNIPETDLTNNVGVSSQTVTVSAIPLELEVPYDGTLANGQSLYFELDVPAGETVRISLDHASPTAWSEMYVKFGSMPTPGQFDFQSGSPGLPDQEIVIPTTQAGKYYILAKASAGATPSAVMVVAEALPFEISQVQPTLLGTGEVTVLVKGARLDTASTYVLQNIATRVGFESTRIQVLSASEARVSFDLSSAAFGDYRLAALGTRGTDAFEALTVEPATPPSALVNIPPIPTIRFGVPSTRLVSLTNSGNVDIGFAELKIVAWNVPGLQIKADGGLINVVPANDVLYGSLYRFGIAPGETVVVDIVVSAAVGYPQPEIGFAVYATPYTRETFRASRLPELAESSRLAFLAALPTLDLDSNEFALLQELFGNSESFASDARALFDEVGFSLLNGEGDVAGLGKGACTVACVVAWQFAMYKCAFLGPTPAFGICAGVASAALAYCLTCNCLEPCAIICFPFRPCECDGALCNSGGPAGNVASDSGCPSCPPPPQCSAGEGAEDCTPGGAGSDPNEKLGVAGFGPERWVAIDEQLAYAIYFENIPEASAPAARVEVRDPLSAALNPSTLRLTKIVVSGVEIAVPPNQVSYSATVDFTQTFGVLVDVIAGVDAASEPPQAFWILQAIDPLTGEPPVDALVGFLPPNDVSGAGEGHVEFSIRPKPGTSTGAVVHNIAEIVFDVNEPIITNTVFNTIDAGAPVSMLSALPLVVSGPEITLSASASDPPGGSGLAGVRFLVSVDGGSLVPFSFTATSTGVFGGAAGHVYGFASQGVDNAGNVEPLGGGATAFTAIPSVALAVGSDSGVVGDGVTNINTPEFLVVSAPLTDVAVTITGIGRRVAGVAKTGVNGRGVFAVPSRQGLADGEYVVTAVSHGVTTGMTLKIDSMSPQIIGWQSVRAHGSIGQASLELPQSGLGVEPRTGGIAEVLLAFDRRTVGAGAVSVGTVSLYGLGVDDAPLDLSGIQVAVTWRVDQSALALQFSPALQVAGRYCIALQGATDVAGNPVAAAGASRSLTVLLGDATGDRRTNNTDVGAVMSLLGTDPIDPSNRQHVVSDLNTDGRIDDADVLIALDARGVDARFIPDPCPQQPKGVAEGDRELAAGARPVPTESSSPHSRNDLDGGLASDGPGRDGDAADTADRRPDGGQGGPVHFFRGTPIELHPHPTLIALYEPTGHRDGAEAAARLLQKESTETLALPLLGWWLIDVDTAATGLSLLEASEALADDGFFVSPVFEGEGGGWFAAAPSILVEFDGRLSSDEVVALIRREDPGSVVSNWSLGGVSNLAVATLSSRDGDEAVRIASALASADGIVFAEVDFVFTGFGPAFGHPELIAQGIRPQERKVRDAAGGAALRMLGDGGEGVTIFGFEADPGSPATVRGSTRTQRSGLGQRDSVHQQIPFAVALDAEDMWVSQTRSAIESLATIDRRRLGVTVTPHVFSLRSNAIARLYDELSASGMIHFATVGDRCEDDGIDLPFPACLETVVAVGGLGADNRPLRPACETGGPDFVARPKFGGPSRDLRTSSPVWSELASVRAGHLAATAWARNPSFDAAELVDLLAQSAVDHAPPGFDPVYGWGELTDAILNLEVVAPEPVAPKPPVVRDLNGDGIVDAIDLGNLLGAWGPCTKQAACPADLNGDGVVDSADIGMLLEVLGTAVASQPKGQGMDASLVKPIERPRPRETLRR